MTNTNRRANLAQALEWGEWQRDNKQPVRNGLFSGVEAMTKNLPYEGDFKILLLGLY